MFAPIGAGGQGATGVHFDVAEFDRERILAMAGRALSSVPAPITTFPAKRSKAGPRTFYTEAADWWPDEAAPGRFVQRDGYTNPEADLAHADALVRVNVNAGALVAAWRLTQEQRYADHALAHLRAWFLNKETAMEPSLDYAGTVAGEGRAEGVADALPLAEIARAASFLCASPVMPSAEADALRGWFGSLLQWMNESRTGALARDRTDTYAICWAALAGEVARFTRNDVVLRECSHRFKDKLLRQMNFDGAFPQELTRRRPYALSLWTLECLALACESISTPFENVWRYQLPDGRGMRSAVSFHFPAIANRGKWAYPADVQHFSDLPVRGGALLFAGRSFDRLEYVDVWKRLKPDPTSAEVARETPVRQPALWAVRPPA